MMLRWGSMMMLTRWSTTAIRVVRRIITTASSSVRVSIKVFVILGVILFNVGGRSHPSGWTRRRWRSRRVARNSSSSSSSSFISESSSTTSSAAKTSAESSSSESSSAPSSVEIVIIEMTTIVTTPGTSPSVMAAAAGRSVIVTYWERVEHVLKVVTNTHESTAKVE